MYKIMIYEDIHHFEEDCNDDIYMEVRVKTFNNLVDVWNDLFDTQGGRAYEIWEGDHLMLSGPYDPWDIDIIMEYEPESKPII